MIKDELSASSWTTKDNTAQKLINNATETDIRLLGVESILRLYEALHASPPRIISANDEAALKKLKTSTQFQPIVNTLDVALNVLLKKHAGSVGARTVTKPLIERLYSAEERRLHWLERIGIDDKTMGPGQLGQLAYTDIKDKSPTKIAWKDHFIRFAISNLLGKKHSAASLHIDISSYSITVPNKYEKMIYSSKPLENWVVTAYLLDRIKTSERPGRTDRVTTKMGVALYHGMRPMIRAAQNQLPNGYDPNDWNILEAQLIINGKQDYVNYANEVVL